MADRVKLILMSTVAGFRGYTGTPCIYHTITRAPANELATQLHRSYRWIYREIDVLRVNLQVPILPEKT